MVLSEMRSKKEGCWGGAKVRLKGAKDRSVETFCPER
jgi:hypothetical protein